MIADIPQLVWAAPAAFGLGLLTGWIISQRYRIVRKPDERDRG